jgi:hypothetical protein
MRILAIDREPLLELLYRTAIPGGGSSARRLPIMRGRVDRLPDGLAALLIASDLQGVAPSRSSGGKDVLLGEVLAEEVERLAREGALPPACAMGVMLAGDLYSAPEGDGRGVPGDVRNVWRTFTRIYPWVVGVSGNHDHFGNDSESARFRAEPGVHLLDGDTILLGGLRIGGVGLIIGKPVRPGKPAKPNRRSKDAFLGALQGVLHERPDVVILHEGPNGGSSRQYGNPHIRDLLAASGAKLAICGHDHWHRPLADIDIAGRRPLQVLNVDSRAVLLTTALA